MLEDQNNVKNHFEEFVGGCSREGKAVGGGQVIFVLVVCFALLHSTFSPLGCFCEFSFHVSLASLLIKEMD